MGFGLSFTFSSFAGTHYPVLWLPAVRSRQTSRESAVTCRECFIFRSPAVYVAVCRHKRKIEGQRTGPNGGSIIKRGSGGGNPNKQYKSLKTRKKGKYLLSAHFATRLTVFAGRIIL